MKKLAMIDGNILLKVMYNRNKRNNNINNKKNVIYFF